MFKKKIDVTKKMCWKKNVDLKVFKKIGYKIEQQVKYFLSKPKKTRKHTRKRKGTKRKGITSKKMNKKNTYKKNKNNFFL